VKEKRGRSLSQDLQVLNINPKLVTVTFLRLGKKVGGWVDGWVRSGNQARNQGLLIVHLNRYSLKSLPSHASEIYISIFLSPDNKTRS
jgi:hypothetical protein